MEVQSKLKRELLGILLLSVLAISLSAPTSPSSFDFPGKDNNYSCYHIQCPKGAVACKRLQTTSKDGSKLITEVECQDDQGTTLDTVIKEEANPFDKATKFTSYSFTGHYESGFGRRLNHNNNLNTFSRFGDNYNSDVEVFK